MAATITQNSKPLRPRALDTSGNNNHGTAYTGQALEFDGVSDKIQIADIVIPDLNTFTMAMWVNFPNAITANYAPCFFIGDTGFNHQDQYALLGLITNDNQIGFSINKTNGGNRAAIKVYSDTLSADTWYRVVGVYDGNADRIYLYVNGVLIGTDTPSDEAAWSAGDAVNFTGSNNDLFMSGGTGLNNSAALEFLGSDAQFWDKAWTQSDVTYDYLNPETLALDTPSTSLAYSNLKLWYPMQDGYRGQQSFLIDGANTGLGTTPLTNSNFDTGDFTGWTAGGSTTSEVVSHDGHSTAAHITTSSTDNGYNQNALTIGQVYKISFDVKVISGSMYLGKNNNRLGGVNYTDSSWTSYTHYWTAGDTYLRVYSEDASSEFYVDNISVLPVNAKNHGTSTFHGDEILSNTGFETLNLITGL